MSRVAMYTPHLREPFCGIKCPHGQPGDQLWVRETWMAFEEDRIHYRADYAFDPKGDEEAGITWRPSIFMPRWASRIQLEITDVRVQRVNDISELDAIDEGAGATPTAHLEWDGEPYEYRKRFHELWDTINAKRGFGWDKNPWVWAITFKRISL